MKRALSIASLAVLTACGGGCGGGGEYTLDVKGTAPSTSTPTTPTTPAPTAPAPTSPVSKCSVDLNGDSIMAGAFSSNGQTVFLAERPAAILKRMRPAYTVVDRSVPGETAAARSVTFYNQTRSGHFQIFEHGLNDATGNTGFEPALRGMVEYVKAEGRVPLITGLSRTRILVANAAAYNAIAAKVASETITAFADWQTVAYDPLDMADDYHPAPKYAERLVARLVERLPSPLPLLQCKRKGMRRMQRGIGGCVTRPTLTARRPAWRVPKATSTIGVTLSRAISTATS